MDILFGFQFFLTPWYSSTVLVEMVVVVLVLSESWVQVAVVLIVRHALQLVRARLVTIMTSRKRIKNFFIWFLLSFRFTFVHIVNTEERAGEGGYFAEGDQERFVYLALWGNEDPTEQEY